MHQSNKYPEYCVPANMCLLFLVPVDFISHIPWNTFIFSFLKEKSKPKPKLSEAPHPAPLSSAFSVLPPGLLILAASLSSFLSSTQRVLAGQDRLFSRLGVYLAIWLSAWDSKYFPIRKHYTSVLPILLLPSSKTLWFSPSPSRALGQHTKPGAALALLPRGLEMQSPSVTALLGPGQCEMRNSSLW